MILDEIAERTRVRVALAKKDAPFEKVKEAALALAAREKAAGKHAGGARSFAGALAAPGLSFICEVKRASPSKGLIAPDFPYLEIAGEYEAAGASAVSVLTEPDYFMGSNEYLSEIAQALDIPVLRKDFIIDPYQIYEAKILGADAVLLICALLHETLLAEYLAAAESLGLDALTEIHSEAEGKAAVHAGAKIIGINNRDLKTFTVDTGVTRRLRKTLPPDIIAAAESGIATPEDIKNLGEGIDAVLVGESFMRAPDKRRHLAALRGAYT